MNLFLIYPKFLRFLQFSLTQLYVSMLKYFFIFCLFASANQMGSYINHYLLVQNNQLKTSKIQQGTNVLVTVHSFISPVPAACF